MMHDFKRTTRYFEKISLTAMFIMFRLQIFHESLFYISQKCVEKLLKYTSLVEYDMYLVKLYKVLEFMRPQLLPPQVHREPGGAADGVSGDFSGGGAGAGGEV